MPRPPSAPQSSSVFLDRSHGSLEPTKLREDEDVEEWREEKILFSHVSELHPMERAH